jgi:hypothetical protein
VFDLVANTVLVKPATSSEPSHSVSSTYYSNLFLNVTL